MGSNNNGANYPNAPPSDVPFGTGYIDILNRTPSCVSGYPPPLPPRNSPNPTHGNSAVPLTSVKYLPNNSHYSGVQSQDKIPYADDVYATIPYADEDYLPTAQNNNRNSKIGFDMGMPQPYPAKQQPLYQPQQNYNPYQQYGTVNNASQYRFDEEQSAKNMPVSFSSMRGYVRQEHKKKQVDPGRHIAKPVPALKPTFHFDPEADAGNLRRAMEGLGTEDKILINILCHRSNEQRQYIQQVYKSPYGRGLIEDVKAKTGGNFEKVLVALLLPPWEYRVKVLHDAFTGIGTDEEALIEFICTYTNREIQVLSQLYHKSYKKTLEHDITAHAPEHMKQLMLATVHGKREEDHTIDPDLARREAEMLVQALKLGSDEDAFNVIFSRRSHEQIRCTDDEYKKLTGRTLEDAIENEFTGCIKDALLAILQYSHNRYEYFANRLHKSMVGFGTNDKHLMRVIVSRSEIDLINIKNAFEHKYGKSLKSWIKGDTSGDYKHCLLTLIQEA